MKEYKCFVDHLVSEIHRFHKLDRTLWIDDARKYLDGAASVELRRLVELETRRESGAFFTDSRMAQVVLDLINSSIEATSVVYDPACGAGNLLLAAANLFQQKYPLLNVDKSILGTDIHIEFIEAARARLRINNIIQNIDQGSSVNEAINGSVIVADGLVENEFYRIATHIVANPPFNLIDSGNSFNWAKGKVSAAAIFMSKIISFVKPGTKIVALLPDVLRSGSRYQKWRQEIESACEVDENILLGQFDKYADVDVFALSLTKKNQAKELNHKRRTIQAQDYLIGTRVEDLFDVCVGPVVDNRDPHTGTSLQYVVSRGLKGWDEIGQFDKVRRHSGKSFESPFIVIKRTSRVGDSSRAIASIINSPAPVYVDNHLIILTPKNGSLEECRSVLRVLQNNTVDNWINEQIRCRHLTVKVVSKIPLWL
jgi:SAM-dependent methyltransferase